MLLPQDQEDEEQEDEEGEEAEDEEDEEEGSDDADAAAGGGSRHRRRKRQRRAQRQRRGELEIVKLPRRTNKAAVQERERLDGGEALPNTKPMMELQAGSNVWYQAYVLKESLNEAKVRFPGERSVGFGCWVGLPCSRGWGWGCCQVLLHCSMFVCALHPCLRAALLVFVIATTLIL